ncbi:glycoside hydrolase family 3 N-terminal domain-containing protein [Hyphobacterium sp. HN65]|uniref:beta-N-acetylhexosaminidase n=1 Tax=Hyphobacterium lacteum TaxID=3116575 RepID=A0ABU7LN82_9PROT|nr:glycoside hydrolase family 3 N-terminal domain-containing protein [Hyphobacterium sp. HN65]MEE2525378.1 glycoside hydrolase family 3 N-terminal domain-containing protein [Hyphobacterium sp. HN65]
MHRRRFLKSVAAGSLLPFAPYAMTQEPLSLRQKAARMLLLGFIGDNVDTDGARAVAAHLEAGRVGGVLFLRHNVRSREGVEGLTAQFRGIAPNAWMAVDQEGGAVQRLSSDLGYSPIPRAFVVSEERSIEDAAALYGEAAREFRAAGFNLNLAPVADVQDDENGVIGRWGRGYGRDGERIAAYAGAFIEAFERAGASCAIKHFPGHGTSSGDSHHGFVDISETWSEAELEPFRRLIDAGMAHLIMGGHLTHSGLDPAGDPVTFSRPILTDLLRGQMGYTGALITDDLDMGAIRENYAQREAVIRSIQAGNDIIMMSNSAAPDPELPQRFASWVEEAVAAGELTERRIDQSMARLDVLARRSG